MVLKIQVEDVAFHSFSNRVRIKGTILEGPEDLVSIGSYHTFNMEVGNSLTIIKEHWPKFALRRLKEAEKAKTSPLALIITIEDGSADIFLAADFGIREAVSITTSISRKRGSQKAHDATMREFYGDVTMAVRSQLEQNKLNVIVIAGPGFVRDHFKDYLQDSGIPDLPPIMVESTNTTGIPGAKEVLYRGVISKAVQGIKLEKETQLIEKILENVAKGNGLGVYGPDEVQRAVQYGAVEELLITDKKLREGTEEERHRMDQLIRDTEKTRGNFHIVSTEHPAGDQLENLGGIAALLRFPIGV
jgi:protein pelota